MAEVVLFGPSDPVSCHSFSPNRSKVAISPNNNEVHIYKKEGSKWVQDCVLDNHGLRVTSIDWGQKTNKIVTCSADRNAYVWSLVDDVWKPTLVILRFNRAATVVRWSPKEDKFAVGSGAKLVSISCFDECHDWWFSKHIKKSIRSTVTCIDWHPNNLLLACGSTDFKVRVFTAHIQEVDPSDPSPCSWTQDLTSLGNLVGEYTSGGGGWVHSVAFSPDGSQIAWVSHDSTISLVDSIKGTTLVFKSPYLPYLSCLWLSPEYIITAGHDCCPMLYKFDQLTGKLKFIDKLDKPTNKEMDGLTAMRKFRDMDKFAISLNDHNSTESSSSIHQNSIKEIRVFSTNKKGYADRVSSVGLDGKMVFWDTSRLV